MSKLNRAEIDVDILTKTVSGVSIIGADFDTLLHASYALMIAITRVRRAGGTPDANALMTISRIKETLHHLKGEEPIKGYPGLFLQRLDDFR